MIKTFADATTHDLFLKGKSSRLPHEIVKRALRKLDQLNAAATLDDLKAPPGNQLHALWGDRAGQHVIRINDQWRICFVFQDGDSFDVEICDYH